MLLLVRLRLGSQEPRRECNFPFAAKSAASRCRPHVRRHLMGQAIKKPPEGGPCRSVLVQFCQTLCRLSTPCWREAAVAAVIRPLFPLQITYATAPAEVAQSTSTVQTLEDAFFPWLGAQGKQRQPLSLPKIATSKLLLTASTKSFTVTLCRTAADRNGAQPHVECIFQSVTVQPPRFKISLVCRFNGDVYKWGRRRA